ncbi:MAG: DUF4363 family protein [Oscillospiraceae bacterium]|nr:DUF4363 family protein [Oscillospiraceae bacterium]
MKRLLLPLLTLLLLGSFSFFNGAFVGAQSDLWCSEIARAQNAAETRHWDETMAILKGIDEDWQGCSTYFHIVIRHDEIDDAEGLLAETMAFAAEKNGAEFRASASKLATQLRRLAEAEEFSIKNIL